jgi:hypothetical protein
VSLEEAALVGDSRPADLVALDDAMNTLAQLDPRKAQVVEMRFFGGLTVEETADALKVSPATVMRDWITAKASLYRELAGGTRERASCQPRHGLNDAIVLAARWKRRAPQCKRSPNCGTGLNEHRCTR